MTLAASALILGAAVGPASGLAQDADGTRGPKQRCGLARALAVGGETKQARRAYVAVLREDSGARCAIKGLKKLNKPKEAESCAEADVAFAAGELDEAEKAYAFAGGDCGTAGIKAVREVEQLCAQGERYDELDRHEDARAAYKKALEKNPKAACAGEGLGSESLLKRVADWVTENVPRLFAALAGAALLLLLLMLIGHWRRLRPHLAGFPLIGRVFSPRLTLKPVDSDAIAPKAGVALTARITERLQSFHDEAHRDHSPDYDIDHGSANEPLIDLAGADNRVGNALDKVGETTEQARLATAIIELLRALVPKYKLTVTGVLDPPTRNASGSFALEGDGRLVASTTLTGPQLEQDAASPDYLHLAEPAAIWIQYETARAVSGGEVSPDEAESYALVRKGLDYQRIADSEKDDTTRLAARAAYEEAITKHPRNWAARVNLAVVMARMAQDFPSSIRTLEEAVEDIRRTEP